MKERPILFSGPMVQAILDGRKTQTRRVLNTQPLDVLPCEGDRVGREWIALTQRDPNQGAMFKCRYGAPGDWLWVRETFKVVPATAYRGSVGVAQTVNPSDPDEAAVYAAGWDRGAQYWKPSIHMPRWASRITLEIAAVRVERVQDISEEDIKAEGVERVQYRGYTSRKVDDPQDFSDLWDSINGARPGCSWADNPWVWVLSFKRLLP